MVFLTIFQRMYSALAEQHGTQIYKVEVEHSRLFHLALEQGDYVAAGNIRQGLAFFTLLFGGVAPVVPPLVTPCLSTARHIELKPSSPARATDEALASTDGASEFARSLDHYFQRLSDWHARVGSSMVLGDFYHV
ncbi:hypothetical protein BGZ79_004631 [Entomortierella chlamydospora]|nr:hypothetical protein BGZ79_004631 [Entomortierella chlamydospora]